MGRNTQTQGSRNCNKKSNSVLSLSFQRVTPHQCWGALVGKRVGAGGIVVCVVPYLRTDRGFQWTQLLIMTPFVRWHFPEHFKRKAEPKIHTSTHIDYHQVNKYVLDIIFPRLSHFCFCALTQTLFPLILPHQIGLESRNHAYYDFGAIIVVFVKCWIKAHWVQMVFGGKSNSTTLQLSVTSCCSKDKDQNS